MRGGAILMAFALLLVLAAVALTAYLSDEPEKAVAAETAEKTPVEPLVRSDPAGEAWKEPASRPDREPEEQLREEEPPAGETDWPMPSEDELQEADGTRNFRLPRGAVMSLTIDAIGIKDAPVIDSDSQRALDRGVIHEPETSFPWSRGAQRNVYLAGHRLGWAGTGSRLIFYHLDKLAEGNEIVLRDRDGKKYTYRVSEVFVADPRDVWVMGQVRGRDMLTLQTCTPIPTFEKRLIVRADRV